MISKIVGITLTVIIIAGMIGMVTGVITHGDYGQDFFLGFVE